MNGEWVKMANGMEVVKGGYRVHGTGSGVWCGGYRVNMGAKSARWKSIRGRMGYMIR